MRRDQLDEDEWQDLLRHADVLRRLPLRPTAGDIADAMAELAVSRATLFRWLKRFRTEERAAALSVHGFDRKPQRRILDHLKKQGVQANQDITLITDGGEEVRSLAEMIAPASEHVLDWFHVTMRITVLRQFA